MAYKIPNSKTKEKNDGLYEMSGDKDQSDADVFNEIETRIRKNKPVSDWEIRLLLEGYSIYNAPIPKEIQSKLKKKGY